MSQYVESIERFTENVNTIAIDNLVKHLGIALHSADGKTVAASDPAELATVRDGFCMKYLDMSPGQADTAIEEVCETMKHDSAKCRVTFYYLLADKAGKLEKFS